MRRWFAGLTMIATVAGLSACHGHGDAESQRQLHGAMATVKSGAEAVLAGQHDASREGLAALARQIAAADRDIDAAEGLATSLTDSSVTQAALRDYLKALRSAVDQTRERYATAVALEEARVSDRTVSASITQAQDEAALERARVDADAKAGAVATAVDHAGDAVVERERRLDALLSAMLRDARPLVGYALVSHAALAAAMASNVGADH